MHIYSITNEMNGKIYIGKTVRSNLRQYFQQKCSEAFRCISKHSHLYAAIRKYGKGHFRIESPISCLATNFQLCLWEKALIYAFNSTNPEVGYNICKGGEGRTGPHSLESRAKMRRASKQRWSVPEAHIKQSKTVTKVWEDSEYRIKQNKSMGSAESRAKKSESIKKHRSQPKVRAKQSRISKQRWSNPDFRIRMTEAHRKQWSNLESRAKMTKSNKVFWSNPEACAKMAELSGKVWANRRLKTQKPQG